MDRILQDLNAFLPLTDGAHYRDITHCAVDKINDCVLFYTRDGSAVGVKESGKLKGYSEEDDKLRIHFQHQGSPVVLVALKQASGDTSDTLQGVLGLFYATFLRDREDSVVRVTPSEKLTADRDSVHLAKGDLSTPPNGRKLMDDWIFTDIHTGKPYRVSTKPLFLVRPKGLECSTELVQKIVRNADGTPQKDEQGHLVYTSTPEQYLDMLMELAEASADLKKRPGDPTKNSNHLHFIIPKTRYPHEMTHTCHTLLMIERELGLKPGTFLTNYLGIGNTAAGNFLEKCSERVYTVLFGYQPKHSHVKVGAMDEDILGSLNWFEIMRVISGLGLAFFENTGFLDENASLSFLMEKATFPRSGNGFINYNIPWPTPGHPSNLAYEKSNSFTGSVIGLDKNGQSSKGMWTAVRDMSSLDKNEFIAKAVSRWVPTQEAGSVSRWRDYLTDVIKDVEKYLEIDLAELQDTNGQLNEEKVKAKIEAFQIQMLDIPFKEGLTKKETECFMYAVVFNSYGYFKPWIEQGEGCQDLTAIKLQEKKMQILGFIIKQLMEDMATARIKRGLGAVVLGLHPQREVGLDRAIDQVAEDLGIQNDELTFQLVRDMLDPEQLAKDEGGYVGRLLVEYHLEFLRRQQSPASAKISAETQRENISKRQRDFFYNLRA